MRRLILSALASVAVLGCLSVARAQSPTLDPPPSPPTSRSSALLRSGGQMYSVPAPAPRSTGTLTTIVIPEVPTYAELWRRPPGPYDRVSPEVLAFLYGHVKGPHETLPAEARLSPYAATRTSFYDPYALLPGYAPTAVPARALYTWYPR